MTRIWRMWVAVVVVVVLILSGGGSVQADDLLAGVARVDVSDPAAAPVHDPCQAKVLVLRQGERTAVFITVDVVAIGEIGLSNRFLPSVRERLQHDLNISPDCVLANASHCHGKVRADSDALVVKAVKEAVGRLVRVRAGVGVATESRISENRRLTLADGRQADMRRAYALPPEETLTVAGPIDPRVGVLRLDRLDGTPLAVLYQFACHPIMNPPNLGSSADFPGYASNLLETALGHDSIAFFVQGCGGDINPRRYKETSHPPDAEPYGNLLGMTVLQAVRSIKADANASLRVAREILSLPRAEDYDARIAAIEAERLRLLNGLTPTNIDFKAFLPLYLGQKLKPEHPAQHAQSYLHNQLIGDPSLNRLDATNRGEVEAYVSNLRAMEQLTRLNVNLALLQKHRSERKAAAASTIDVELCGLRVGDFKLLTFPGELTSGVGLQFARKANDPHTFLSGYTNGYIYYTPTAAERKNSGYAQEDCDSIVAPEWHDVFEKRALSLLQKLGR
ncbi:MAG: hypothetical protein U0794_19615 [Isosphaeraceae bacterium]